MTYLMAWKIGGFIYLLADTAETTPWRDPIPRSSTSFGEASVSQPHESVHEGALKLLNFERAVIGMAGDASKARSIAATFKEALRYTDTPRAAFDYAITSNAPFDLDPQRSCTVVIAFPNTPTPTLLSFNLNGDLNTIEHHEDCFLAIGSMPQKYKEISLHILEEGAHHFHNEPAQFLISVLAIIQSLVMREYLLEKGIGGVFCGLFIGEHSIQWQGDILFILHNGGNDPEKKMVLTIVRDHVLGIHSTMNDISICLINELSCNSFQDWPKKFSSLFYTFMKDARFDYIILLSIKFPHIIIVEILKNRFTRHLSIKPLPTRSPLENIQLQIGFSPELRQLMDEPATYPYELKYFELGDL